MREQHPIDELFARALRESEAEPPPKAWEGIVRGRKGRRLRRWAWLPLLLLLGGAAGALLLAEHDGHGTQNIGPGKAITVPALENTAQPSSLAQSAQPANDRLADTLKHPGTLSAANDQQVALSAAAESPQQSAAVPAANGSGTTITPKNGQQFAGTMRNGNPDRQASTRPAPVAVLSESSQGHPGVSEAAGNTTPYTAMAPNIAGGVARNEHPAIAEAELETRRAFPLLPRRTRPVPYPLASTPAQPQLIGFVGPQRRWWIAATAGQYRETRHWAGGDGQLREALNSTETHHYTYSAGFMGGLNFRGGWSVATGAEYRTGRFDFHHTDRFQMRRDSIISTVLTFNSLVLATTTDTITTYSTVDRSVSEVNRYSTLRIPVELGWHKGLRRFRLGARAGLALELNEMRSGATLAPGHEGVQSVDVASTQVSCSSVLAGSVAADLGYMLSERWAVWASPVYEFGLLSLLPADGLPVALPERAGLRFSISYQLHHLP